MPITPGKQTSEHRLTQLVLLIGFALQVFAGILGALQTAGIGQGSAVIPVSLAVISGLMQVASVLGYTSARAKLKIAQLAGVEPAPEDAP